MHNELTLKYFFDRQHAGAIEKSDGRYTAEYGTVDQGDVIQIEVLMEDNVIQQARFQCYGSVVSIAACEFVCRWLEGKNLEQVTTLQPWVILKGLGLTSLHNHVAWRLIECIKQFP